MNEMVMILREGKMGRIIMMMKVITVAIYLCGADVVAQSWPLCFPSRSQMIFPLKHILKHAHTCTCFTLAHTNTVKGLFIGSLPYHDICLGN